jgi:flavin reductase (DIM6/NTAB) family NADH-FMN oxidoreductase RutF
MLARHPQSRNDFQHKHNIDRTAPQKQCRCYDCGMPEIHFYEPRLGHGLPHDPFKAIVAPRPIGWISSINRAGNVNLAPYSFFNAFSEDPPIIGFSSHSRKDSQRNIEENGEFVYNLATRALAEQMVKTSAELPHGMSEFEFVGLESAACRIVRPPRVMDSPVALECKLTEIIPIKNLEGKATKNHLILGQVVGVHIDRTYITADGLFDMTLARTVARCGYKSDYAEVEHLFHIDRPKK